MDLKFGTRGFLGSLITNPSSKLTNTKWRIQYGEQKWKKLLIICDDILYPGLFGGSDYESKLKIKKFEIADLTWQTKMQNLLDCDDILYAGVFGVADYRSMLKIRKFIMAHPIWRTKMRNYLNWMKLGIRGTQRSKIKNGGSNMVSKDTKGGKSRFLRSPIPNQNSSQKYKIK